MAQAPHWVQSPRGGPLGHRACSQGDPILWDAQYCSHFRGEQTQTQRRQKSGRLGQAEDFREKAGSQHHPLLTKRL